MARKSNWVIMLDKNYYTYILASRQRGTLYIGVTNNLIKRVFEHKEAIASGFTQKYSVHNLVYYECYEDISVAIEREKQLKKWNRDWKIQLIEQHNPQWFDLYSGLNG